MRLRSLLRGLPLVAVCACAQPTALSEQDQQALIGAEPSTPEEDAAVLVRIRGDGPTCSPDDPTCTVCSGRLVTPRLVLTAHHCLLRTKLSELNCDADGNSVGEQFARPDMTLEAPANINVYVGHELPVLRPVAVEKLVTGFLSHVCNYDLAYLVLAEPALDVRTPLRRAPVQPGERFSVSGWGFTRGAGELLPEQRYTRTDVRVEEVGPSASAPKGMFLTGGNSLCQGDSGAVAVINGAAVGVFSRISGPCALPATRSFLQGVEAMRALNKDAFAAVGEEITYADDPDNDADAGPDAAPTAPEAGGCTAGHDATSSALLLAAGAALLGRRRRADFAG